MKQTVIALIPVLEELTKHPYDITDKEYLERALLIDRVYTLKEFQELWNTDEIKVKDYIIRVLEVESSLKISLG